MRVPIYKYNRVPLKGILEGIYEGSYKGSVTWWPLINRTGFLQKGPFKGSIRAPIRVLSYRGHDSWNGALRVYYILQEPQKSNGNYLSPHIQSTLRPTPRTVSSKPERSTTWTPIKTYRSKARCYDSHYICPGRGVGYSPVNIEPKTPKTPTV